MTWQRLDRIFTRLTIALFALSGLFVAIQPSCVWGAVFGATTATLSWRSLLVRQERLTQQWRAEALRQSDILRSIRARQIIHAAIRTGGEDD